MRKCTDAIVGAAVEIYSRMSTDLLPTPAKSHYVFNLRDLSKCVQGMCDSVINIGLRGYFQALLVCIPDYYF